MNQPKEEIKRALQRFSDGNLAENARYLLNVLGYRSERRMELEPNNGDGFLSAFDRDAKINTDRALLKEWESVDLLFQLTEEEVVQSAQRTFQFGGIGVDRNRFESYLFFALELSENDYSRTKLSQITREINKPFNMPAMILFKHGETLTFAVIDRRLHKRDESKDVLEKTTFIKDINFADPHPAHIVILFDLSIDALHRKHQFSNFDELHAAWRKTLDTSELNKRFYREIANWYFWAVDRVTFPDGAEKVEEVRNKTSMICLITRLIFVWFIKEKGLVSNDLFDYEKIKEILISTDPQESTYYKAILQNLFFATLNQEMNTSEKPNNRKFRGEGRQHYNITSLYRYKRYFTDPDESLKLFEAIPFLNGGLFECLDKPDKDDPKRILRIDGFSDRDDISLQIPNKLFFSEEHNVDLNAAYGTKGRGYKVRGLINILDRYKFTIAENTPIEEEVALDPELLGKVFENLLAAYNPETGASARKQSGSFYTPREIVNYMTDESLIAYLKHKCIAYHESHNTLAPTTPPAQLDFGGRAEPVQTQIDTQGVTLSDEQKDRIEANLRNLFAYNDEPHRFNHDESEVLINVVDSLKILDPACGSGAFPMGVLHKLVFILGKLDPRNDRWRKRQIDKVQTTIKTGENIDDSAVRENTIRDLEHEIDNINEAFERNELDYGRKLYLIENCIYGVDIQPIAVQIAKLRFFISLVVDQKMDESRANRGVRPLPNLETKFVAANTLLSLEKPAQFQIRNPQIHRVEKELSEVRRKHFAARTPKTKAKFRALDAQLRTNLSELFKDEGFPHETTEKIAFWDPYDQNEKADWFDPEWMFGITDGFDVVIGNPPYKQVRKGIHSEQLFPYSEGQDKGKQNLYKLFVEQSYNLCRQSGIATLIVQSSLMCDLSSSATRELLLTRTRLNHCIEFPKTAKSPDTQVFSAVWQGTCIYQFAKSDPDGKPVNLSVGNDTHSIENPRFAPITKDEILTLYPDLKCLPHIKEGSVSILKKIAADKTIQPLCKFVLDIRQGDINLTTHRRFFSTCPTQVCLLRGRHVARFMVNYDAATEYFEQGYMPDTVKYNRNKIALVCQQITGTVDPRRLHFAATEHPPVDVLWGNSVNKILLKKPQESLAILALLNSRFMDWYFRITSTNNHVQGYELEQLPIPLMSATRLEKLNSLAKQIMEAKRTASDEDQTVLENEIDQIVYSLYDLTRDEIAIVEDSYII